MTSKKVLSNGKAEILANYLTQQMSETQLRICNVILSVKYPVADHTTFCTLVDKVKEDEYIKQLVVDTFTAHDFGLTSPVNAIEKYFANLNMGTTTSNVAWNTPVNHPYTTAQHVGMTSYGYLPQTSVQSPMGYSNPMQVNTPQNWGWNMNSPYAYGSTGMTAWGRNVAPVAGTTPNNWVFGNDVCGEVACSLFCDWVSQGMNPVNAYTICRDKEIQCRNILPSYGTDIMSLKAQSIFVHNFICWGKNVSQCDWAARFFLNNCQMPVGTTTTTTTVSQHTVPSVERSVVESVN